MSRAEKAKEVSKALKNITASNPKLNYNEWRVIAALERAVDHSKIGMEGCSVNGRQCLIRRGVEPVA